MEYQANINSEELSAQMLLSNYLLIKDSSNGLHTESKHLDEDYLAAFVEGSLVQRESQPIVAHLVDCSFCRNLTAELVKLDFAFAAEETQAVISLETPSKISRVLSSVLTRIFGANDGAVFAHQENDEESNDLKEDKED